jgi:hypothetical protein
VPFSSSVPVGVAQTGSTPTWSFTPDVSGCFIIQLTVSDGATPPSTASDARAFGIYETLGSPYLIPSFTGDNNSLNFGGQTTGWDFYMEKWLKLVTTLAAGSGITQLTGDVLAGPGTGSQVATVVALQGNPVANTSPTNTYVLTWNGTHWAPAPGGGGGSSVTGTGLWYSASGVLNAAAVTLTGDLTPSVLSGSNLPVTVSSLQGTSLTISSPSLDQVLTWNGSAWANVALPNATGGGSGLIQLNTDLGGTYNAPQVVGILDHSLPSFSVGFLYSNGTTWSFTQSGDTTISAGAVHVTGLLSNALPSLSTGYLEWTGSAWAFGSGGGSGAITSLTGAVTGTGPGATATTITPGTSAQVLMSNATPTTTWTTISGDISLGATGSVSVVALRGNAVSNTNPTSAHPILIWNGSTWAPSVITGDLSIGTYSGSAQPYEVTGLLNNALPSLTTGYLNWTGSAWALTAVTSGINQLTGDVTAGPGTGSQAATVVQAQAGEYVFGSGGTMTWATGATPLITQASTTSATPATFTITPQTSTAGATASGSILSVSLSAPGASGSFGYFEISQGGSVVAYFTAFPLNTSYGAMYLTGNAPNSQPSSPAVLGDATYTYFNGPVSGQGIMSAGLGIVSTWNLNSIQFFSSINLDLGGGAGVMGIGNASTVPTSTPSGGGVLWAAGGALKWIGSSGTTTTMAPADLEGFLETSGHGHCPVCGTDFGCEWKNEKYGSLTICMSCLADKMGENDWIVRKVA